MNPMQIMQMVGELKSNPMAVLSNLGVPQNIANNPMEVVQFLMNKGRVSQGQYNDAVRQAQQMGFKI